MRIQQTDQVISFFKNTDACVYLHIEWKWDAITSGCGRRMLMQVWRDGREGELPEWTNLHNTRDKIAFGPKTQAVYQQNFIKSW